MTEDNRAVEWWHAIEQERDAAHLEFSRQFRGIKSIEEAIHTQRQQTIMTITEQPGGRLLIYVEVYGKKPNKKVTTYNRYQRIPDDGYVRVFHRQM